jgi:alpha-mannosidase
MKRIVLLSFLLVCALGAQTTTLYVVPNTHGTIGGWLVDFDTERGYVLNNYLDHLDRVASDPAYRFAYSEVPNLITFLERSPQRLNELKQRIKEGRVELANGFFLEPSVSLSGGEALAQMGVLGLRWYDKVFGLRPRHCWMIDITGAHRQLPQIVAGLGLDSLVFCRNNPAGVSSFYWVAPDGTRQLTINDIRYAEFPKLFTAKEPFTDRNFAEIAERVAVKKKYSASPTTVLTIAGAQDYSLPPLRASFPSEFLNEWRQRYPDIKIRFSIPSDYVDALMSEVRSGKTVLQEYRGDTAQCFNAFWLDMPQVKEAYRQGEHLLQTSELLSTAASLKAGLAYPAQGFYDSWIQMLLNMDRNTLWGSAGGMVFRDAKHWDAFDRFESVDRQATAAAAASLKKLAAPGPAVALANPLNWRRDDPIRLPAPLAGVPCQALPGGSTEVVCRPQQPSAGMATFAVAKSVPPSQAVPLQTTVETDFYRVVIDAKTGALTSLQLKASGREMLGGPANVVLAESVADRVKTPVDYMVRRGLRKIVSTSSDRAAQISVFRGPLFTLIRATSDFAGASKLERNIFLYTDHPRIDFETVLNFQENDVLVTVDFPLAGELATRTRGIPFGFATLDPRHPTPPLDYHMSSDHKEYGYTEAMAPAVRWSDYGFAAGGGVALLDYGLSYHELNGSVVTLGLLNGQTHYRKLPNEMLLGHGTHHFHYALVPHPGPWQELSIPRRAWEFNSRAVVQAGARAGLSESWLETSDNVIVEAVRRVGGQIEVRLAEWEGAAADAWIELKLPHGKTAITNLMGEKATPLSGGPRYNFAVRPQQIVTLRFDAASAVPEPAPLLTWKSLVPPAKQAGLEMRITEKGHPPRSW